MPFDPEKYAAELLSEADDLSPEDKAAIARALKNPKVAKKAEETAMLRSDYSRSLDTHRAAETEWNSEKQRYQKWYDEQKAKVDEILSQNGNPHRATSVPGNPNVMRTETGQFVSKAEIEDLKKTYDDRFNRQGEAFLGVLEDSLTLADDFRARFSERLPIDEVRKLAVEKGTTLKTAYDIYIQPKVSKQQEEQWAKKIEDAKEEGRREERSRASNPATRDNVEDHPVFGRRDRIAPEGKDWSKMTSEEREAASMQKFEQDWNKTHGFTQN